MHVNCWEQKEADFLVWQFEASSMKRKNNNNNNKNIVYIFC